MDALVEICARHEVPLIEDVGLQDLTPAPVGHTRAIMVTSP